MRYLLSIVLVLAVAAPAARADEDPEPEPNPIGDVTLGLTSTAAAVGCINLTPYAGGFAEICDGLADAFESYGVALGFTVPVAGWTQSQWTLSGGMPGRKRLRMGPAVGFKEYRACLYFACDDGTAFDLFLRIDLASWVGSSVALLGRIELGGSRVEHENGEVEWLPYLGAKFGVAFGR